MSAVQLYPYLSFNGECEAAFRCYEKALGGKIVYLMTYGESPVAGETPPEWRGKVYHATFTAGAVTFAGADPLPAEYRKPQGFTVMLQMDGAEETERAFTALAEGANVQMPLQETFWALRFGALTDRFGTPWIIQCEKPT